MSETTAKTLPAPFRFDAEQFLASRSLGETPDIKDIESDPLIESARSSIKDLLEGRLPEGVRQELARQTSEVAHLGGITGPAARAFELRDLGVSKLDAMTQGISMAGEMEQLRVAREQVNRDNQLKLATLREEIRTANDRFALAVTDAQQNQARIGLAALQFQAANRQFRIEQENRLIISNSQMEIDNLQQNMDTLQGSFDDFNSQAQRLIDFGA